MEMDATVHTNTRSASSLWYLVFRQPRPLETETTLYVLASALDLFMTYILLRYQGDYGGPTTFYESNPVAHYFFLNWGFPGMVFFKFGIVALVAIIVQIVAQSRLTTARWVFNFGTTVVACVVVYSLLLYLRGNGLL